VGAKARVLLLLLRTGFAALSVLRTAGRAEAEADAADAEDAEAGSAVDEDADCAQGWLSVIERVQVVPADSQGGMSTISVFGHRMYQSGAG
jgi:hypothetical protein